LTECIHGFDDGLCAICFPPKVPEPAAPPPSTSRQRTPRVAARVPGATASAGVSGSRPSRAAGGRSSRLSDAPPVDVTKLRVYHLTHLDNLARILGSGALHADAGDPAATPVVDIAAPAAREYRRSAPVGDGETTLAGYVPFFLSTDAHFWVAIRDGEPDPRLAPPPAGETRQAAQFVLLVSSVAQTLGARAAVEGHVAAAETDASLPGAEVAVGWPDAERLLGRLAVGDDDALAAGEFLVRGEVPLERIQLIAVANDRVRDRVRSALAAVGAKTRVAVYPPWFQASEA
jgi:hypothetical protein